jgi:hypothetical protein
MIKNKRLVIFLSAVFSLAIYLSLSSYLQRREAGRVVQAVLERWKEGDLPRTYDYWEDLGKSPPVYDILSYKINQRSFNREGGQWKARISVTLEFSSSNVLLSGKEWIFELRKTQLGWKIAEFYPSDQ